MNSTTDYPSTELATFSHLYQTLSEHLLGLDLVLFLAFVETHLTILSKGDLVLLFSFSTVQETIFI